MRYPGRLLLRRLVFAVAFAATGIVVRSAPSNPVRVVASVVSIAKREAPLSAGIEVEFMVHDPERLRATKFILVVNSADRAHVRAAHPIGLLESVELPASTVEALVKQRKTWESTERQIDNGTRPEMISKAILLPSVDAEGLRFEPARVQNPE